MTVTSDIEFYQIRGLGRAPYTVRAGERKPLVALPGSILFDRYRHARALRGANYENKTISALSAGTHSPGNGTSLFGGPSIDRLKRKARKLERDPEKFFADSRYAALRLVGRLSKPRSRTS
jgi:hypothetical protein